MRAALISLPITEGNPEKNLQTMQGILEEAMQVEPAILFGPDGKLLHKHRQVRNGKPYLCGDSFVAFDTTLGTVLIAICADVWSDELLTYIESVKPEYVIFPTDFCGEDNELGLINNRKPPEKLCKLKERSCLLTDVGQATMLSVNCYGPDTSKQCGAYGGAFALSKGKEIAPVGFKMDWWRQPVDKPIYVFDI